MRKKQIVYFQDIYAPTQPFCTRSSKNNYIIRSISYNSNKKYL